MRFVLAALVALALGLLPAGTARAMSEAPPAPMSCHEMGGDPGMLAHRRPASDDMRSCADHCLSQVSADLTFVRLAGPSLLAAIDSERMVMTDPGKPRLSDPPDPPPPRR
jgi:hypothetical protein